MKFDISTWCCKGRRGLASLMWDNRYTALSTWIGNLLGKGGGFLANVTLVVALGLFSTLDPAGRTLPREKREDKLPNFRPDADIMDSLRIGEGDRVVGGLGDSASVGNSSEISGALTTGSALLRFILLLSSVRNNLDHVDFLPMLVDRVGVGGLIARMFSVVLGFVSWVSFTIGILDGPL